MCPLKKQQNCLKVGAASISFLFKQGRYERGSWPYYERSDRTLRSGLLASLLGAIGRYYRDSKDIPEGHPKPAVVMPRDHIGVPLGLSFSCFWLSRSCSHTNKWIFFAGPTEYPLNTPSDL